MKSILFSVAMERISNQGNQEDIAHLLEGR